jgi:hypothetical protein
MKENFAHLNLITEGCCAMKGCFTKSIPGIKKIYQAKEKISNHGE